MTPLWPCTLQVRIPVRLGKQDRLATETKPRKDSNMIPKKLRLFVAGLVAFLVGMPMAGEAFASSIGIAGSIADLVDASINASSGDS